jgi:hypothetical protein
MITVFCLNQRSFYFKIRKCTFDSDTSDKAAIFSLHVMLLNGFYRSGIGQFHKLGE